MKVSELEHALRRMDPDADVLIERDGEVYGVAVRKAHALYLSDGHPRWWIGSDGFSVADQALIRTSLDDPVGIERPVVVVELVEAPK